MDKFGRTRRYAGSPGTKQQILIPNNLLRTDGTNAMQANMNVNNNDIVNVETIEGDDVTLKSTPASDNSLIPRYMLDVTRGTVNTLFDKQNAPMILKGNATITASSHHDNQSWTKPENLIDNDSSSVWVVHKSEVKTYAWILLELPTPVQIWRCDLHPRPGSQQTTHALTHYFMEGSLDNKSFHKIFESRLKVDRERYIEFGVTPPYKYFKLTCAGNQQYGLSELKLYEAKVKSGSSTVKLHPNGYLVSTPSGLRLDPHGIEVAGITTQLIDVDRINGDKAELVELTIDQNSPNRLRLEAGKISGLIAPVDGGDAVNKKYVDDFRPYKHFLGSHNGSQQAHTVFDFNKLYNDLCVSSAGVLTINDPGILEILMDIWRQASSFETSIILYLGSNSVKVKFRAGEDRTQIFMLKKVSSGFLIKCGTASSNNYVVSFKMKNYITSSGSFDPNTLMFIAVADINSYIPDFGIIEGDILRNDFRHEDGTVTITRDGELKVFIDIMRKDFSKVENYVLRHRYATKPLSSGKEWDPSQYKEYAIDLPIGQHYVKYENTLQVKKTHVLQLFPKEYIEQAYITMKYVLS